MYIKKVVVMTVDDSVKKQVESILFSANNPISVRDIREITGLEPQTITAALRSLRKEYNQERNTAMEIVKIGNKYVMQVPDPYQHHSMMIAPPAIDDDTLKTLSLIAFHQPIKQSNLRRMVGEKIYEQVDSLTDLGLIQAKKHRNTEMVTLSRHFPEYFGLEMTDPEEIRKLLMEKVASHSYRQTKKEEKEQ
jgi:segregation and condensation protein B